MNQSSQSLNVSLKWQECLNYSFLVLFHLFLALSIKENASHWKA